MAEMRTHGNPSIREWSVTSKSIDWITAELCPVLDFFSYPTCPITLPLSHTAIPNMELRG
jgi:hypothetical protein